MSLPAVLVRLSTQSIIKFSPYPREDMEPVQDLDPDLEWLLINEPYPPPDYDSRLYLLVKNEPDMQLLDDFEQHPDYSHLREYLITWSTVRRPDEEIIKAIEDKETLCNDSMHKMAARTKFNTIAIAVLFRALDGLELTTKEQAIKDKILALAVRIWKNDQLMKDKVDEVQQGLEPEIDDPLWESDL